MIVLCLFSILLFCATLVYGEEQKLNVIMDTWEICDPLFEECYPLFGATDGKWGKFSAQNQDTPVLLEHPDDYYNVWITGKIVCEDRDFYSIEEYEMIAGDNDCWVFIYPSLGAQYDPQEVVETGGEWRIGAFIRMKRAAFSESEIEETLKKMEIELTYYSRTRNYGAFEPSVQEAMLDLQGLERRIVSPDFRIGMKIIDCEELEGDEKISEMNHWMLNERASKGIWRITWEVECRNANQDLNVFAFYLKYEDEVSPWWNTQFGLPPTLVSDGVTRFTTLAWPDSATSEKCTTNGLKQWLEQAKINLFYSCETYMEDGLGDGPWHKVEATILQ